MRVAGSEEAVREVFDAHYGQLVGWTTRLVDDPDLAHDFVTEAFVRLLRHWSSVQNPRAWLYTAVTNQVRDHWRRRGREAAAYDKWHAGSPVGIDVAAPGPDPADRLTVQGAVLALPDRLRAVVLLHYFADLPVVQVAQSLRKSEGAVKRDLFDARRLLANELEGVR
ncbi:RNA polymerase sigma factor [Luteipulveratus flavus]|uniref:RNA polymerase sigma factor n=1 Tax=Luteipulveratus flavus TaxID=3031728 RepID=A0ABT6CEV5_9MICO|nr:RNA polymerase sigma factor [Luteipulveratus sp. YIM 133296]MDF8265826.1 RNA polymerase sigma factor [Luteipulveratus sp. YIM 133296]